MKFGPRERRIALIVVVVLAVAFYFRNQLEQVAGGKGLVLYAMSNGQITKKKRNALLCSAPDGCSIINSSLDVVKCCGGQCVYRQECRTNQDCGDDRPYCFYSNSKNDRSRRCVSLAEANGSKLGKSKVVLNAACKGDANKKYKCVCSSDDECKKPLVCKNNICQKKKTNLGKITHNPSAFNQMATECPVEWEQMTAPEEPVAPVVQDPVLPPPQPSDFTVTVWMFPSEMKPQEGFNGTTVPSGNQDFDDVVKAIITNDFTGIDDALLAFRPQKLPGMTSTFTMEQLMNYFKNRDFYLIRANEAVDVLLVKADLDGSDEYVRLMKARTFEDMGIEPNANIIAVSRV